MQYNKTNKNKKAADLVVSILIHLLLLFIINLSSDKPQKRINNDFQIKRINIINDFTLKNSGLKTAGNYNTKQKITPKTARKNKRLTKARADNKRYALKSAVKSIKKSGVNAKSNTSAASGVLSKIAQNIERKAANKPDKASGGIASSYGKLRGQSDLNKKLAFNYTKTKNSMRSSSPFKHNTARTKSFSKKQISSQRANLRSKKSAAAAKSINANNTAGTISPASAGRISSSAALAALFASDLPASALSKMTQESNARLMPSNKGSRAASLIYGNNSSSTGKAAKYTGAGSKSKISAKDRLAMAKGKLSYYDASGSLVNKKSLAEVSGNLLSALTQGITEANAATGTGGGDSANAAGRQADGVDRLAKRNGLGTGIDSSSAGEDFVFTGQLALNSGSYDSSGKQSGLGQGLSGRDGMAGGSIGGLGMGVSHIQKQSVGSGKAGGNGIGNSRINYGGTDSSLGLAGDNKNAPQGLNIGTGSGLKEAGMQNLGTLNHQSTSFASGSDSDAALMAGSFSIESAPDDSIDKHIQLAKLFFGKNSLKDQLNSTNFYKKEKRKKKTSEAKKDYLGESRQKQVSYEKKDKPQISGRKSSSPKDLDTPPSINSIPLQRQKPQALNFMVGTKKGAYGNGDI